MVVIGENGGDNPDPAYEEIMKDLKPILESHVDKYGLTDTMSVLIATVIELARQSSWKTQLGLGVVCENITAEFGGRRTLMEMMR